MLNMNGVELQSVTYNGAEVNSWTHDGIEVYARGNYIIRNGIYNEEEYPFTTNPTVENFKMTAVNTDDGVKFVGVNTYAAHKYACFEMMDWSEYSKIKMKISDYRRNDCVVGITSNPNLYEYNLELNNLAQLSINNVGELEMDISNVNATGRLYIRVIGDGYVVFDDLYFE